MTTLARIAIAALLALFASSCAFDLSFGNGPRGNGEIVEEAREVTEDFTEVHAAEGMDVFVTQGTNFSINVEADENIIDLIGTDVRNGKLKIHAIENIGRATKKIYVSLPEIAALTSSSGADLVVEQAITAEKITLSASSGSDLSVEITADEVVADASSGADIDLSGSTNALQVAASSGSDIDARRLLAQTCTADASSGADISVNVSEALIADATSGADIAYSGEAKVQKNKSVSGSVY
ncbi:MAG: head GIN domain-containing protein, partial [Bacteroidota bacterium]